MIRRSSSDRWVAQIEDGFPELRDPEADERMHPAMRLSRALSRVSEQALVPRGARLVVLIDTPCSCESGWRSCRRNSAVWRTSRGASPR